MSRFAPVCIGALLLAGLFAPAPAGADPYSHLFFDPPDPPQPVVPVPPEVIRNVLQSQGAELIGWPEWRGFNIIAMGRDRFGAERRYTLDAPTGWLLTVVLVRPAPVPGPPPVNPRLPLRRPLGPPVHPAGNLDADHLMSPPPPPPPPDEVMPPPPPRPPPPPPPPPMDMDIEPMVVAPVGPMPPGPMPPGPPGPPPGPPRPVRGPAGAGPPR